MKRCYKTEQMQKNQKYAKNLQTLEENQNK